MQVIEFVEKGDLRKVRDYLTNGYKIVSVTPVAENVAIDGCANISHDGHTEKGSVYAYIVLEK